MPRDIAVFVGSLRKESFNRKMAKALVELAPESLNLEIIEIGQLPLYNQDDDERGNPPATWVAFRQRVASADAVLFVTPEYNRSVPAVLKNALDVGLSPYGQTAWNAKPGAVGGNSPVPICGICCNSNSLPSLLFIKDAPLAGT